MLTNPCFCVFGDTFPVLNFYCTHFQAIFPFNKIFIDNFFKYNFKAHWSIYFVIDNNKK